MKTLAHFFPGLHIEGEEDFAKVDKIEYDIDVASFDTELIPVEVL